VTLPPPLGVVAVGGNALQSDGRDDLTAQWSAARVTAGHLADLAATGMRLVVTHGNGPQVGHELRRSERAGDEVPRLSMDVAVAHTQGGIGYLLVAAVSDALAARGIDRPTVAVVTRTLVEPDDPAFAEPTKPIGSFMSEALAQRMARTRGWHVRNVSPRGWRRVVASPRPTSVPEIESIRRLAGEGAVVVAGGGGGIPMVRRDGHSAGVPAVIDKDLVSSLIARALGARLLIIATDVERVALHFGAPDEMPLARLSVTGARRHLAEGEFPAGSMGPKVTAAVEYVEATGGRAVITRLDRIVDAWRGEAGTEIVTDDAL
jgi:carbamate kinase